MSQKSMQSYWDIIINLQNGMKILIVYLIKTIKLEKRRDQKLIKKRAAIL